MLWAPRVENVLPVAVGRDPGSFLWEGRHEKRAMGGILCRENCLKRVKRQESENAVGLLREWQAAHLGWSIDLGIRQGSSEQHVGTGSLRVSPHQTKRPGLPWACWGESMRTADGGNNKT